MADNSLQLGNLTILSVLDTTTVGRPSAMWPGKATEEAMQPHSQWLNERGLLSFGIRSFLIRTANGPLTLVDTGIGGRERTPEPGGLRFRPGRLLEALAENGVRPDEVDLVLITHLHIDHVGWNTIDRSGRRELTFPRARYAVQRREWDYWTQPERASAPHIQDCVLPLQHSGQLDLFDAEHSLTPELTAISTPGHTPGHCSVVLVSDGQRAVITGDVAHSPVQLTETEWSLALDVDPSLAARTRAAFADRFDAEQATVIGTHFPQPAFGRFIHLNGRRYWQAL